MANKNPTNGFEKDPERARLAGQKSKRGGLEKRIREWYENPIGDMPRVLKKAIKKLGFKEDTPIEEIHRTMTLVNSLKRPDILDRHIDRGYGKAKEYVDFGGKIEHTDLRKFSNEDLAKLAGRDVFKTKPKRLTKSNKPRNSVAGTGKKKSK